ncbi:hypothetical protein [Methylobacterium nigriterrae]|uniref:hypothetical protein n=1 Tax=Methylobacterium nigriterrae TaxID=3127512 RepID=UPI0030140C3C
MAGVATGILFLGLCPAILLTYGAPALVLPALFSVFFLLTFRTAVPAFLMLALIFQNVAIALWVREDSSVAEVNTARALSFLITASIFAAVSLECLATGRTFPRADRRLIRLGALALALIGAHTALGVAVAGPGGALAYARNMTLVPVSLILGLAFGRVCGREPLRWFGVAFAAILVFGYAEMLFRESFYDLIGFDQYLLRITERASDIQFRLFLGFAQWLQAQQTTLFNDPNLAESGLTGVRLVGPTGHPISFGYAVVVASLPLLARAPITILLLQVPLHYGINSKGAFLLLLICAAVRLAPRSLTGQGPALRMLGLGVLWGLVSLVAILLGLRHGDFHVLGLIGGFKAFLANPLGHGVGTGGNLTEAGINGQIDFIEAQQAGLTRGIESAIGVMVDQLGIACLPYLLLVWAVFRRLASRRDGLSLVLACATLGLLANGLMQEEALFSPSSAGLLFLLVGLVFAQPSPWPERGEAARADRAGRLRPGYRLPRPGADPPFPTGPDAPPPARRCVRTGTPQ